MLSWDCPCNIVLGAAFARDSRISGMDVHVYVL